MTTTFTIIKKKKKTYEENTVDFKSVLTPESFITTQTPLKKTIIKKTKKTKKEFHDMTPDSIKTMKTPPKEKPGIITIKKTKNETQDSIKTMKTTAFYSPNDTWRKLKKDVQIYNFLSTVNKLRQGLDKLPGSTNRNDFLELIAKNLGTENNNYFTTFVKQLIQEEFITWIKIFKDKYDGNDISHILNLTDKGLNYIQRPEDVQNKNNPSQNIIIKSNLPSVEVEGNKDAHTAEKSIKTILPSYAQFKEINNKEKEKTQKAQELVNEGNTYLSKMNIINLLN